MRAVLTAGVFAAVTSLGFAFYDADFLDIAIALAYFLAVIVTAWLTDSFAFSLLATVSATAAFNFFFTDPYFSFNVYNRGYITTFITISAGALLSGALILHARRSALIARQKEAETATERYRANLLRSISHDIRTPLAAMIGTAEMLNGMTGPDDPRRGLICDIQSEADWLRSLVENILNLTRLQDGPASLLKQPEAAEEVVGEAIRHIKQRSPDHKITVHMPEALLLAPMDAKLIRQVLINLLDNAVRHTAPEDAISVTVENTGAAARFSVLDEGPGIGESDLPNVFQTFYTTRAGHADAGPGVGLGLAICETIVKAHGGEITARNRADRTGAELVFTLPMEGEGI